MQTNIEIVFDQDTSPMSANARFEDGKTIRTDLPPQKGGNDTAPNPFELFQAAMCTCAAIFAKRFFAQHNLEMDGFAMKAELDIDEKENRVQTVNYHLTLPEGFPEKYKNPLIRSMEQCTVKKNILTPPDFQVTLD